MVAPGWCRPRVPGEPRQRGHQRLHAPPRSGSWSLKSPSMHTSWAKPWLPPVASATTGASMPARPSHTTPSAIDEELVADVGPALRGVGVPGVDGAERPHRALCTRRTPPVWCTSRNRTSSRGERPARRQIAAPRVAWVDQQARGAGVDRVAAGRASVGTADAERRSRDGRAGGARRPALRRVEARRSRAARTSPPTVGTPPDRPCVVKEGRRAVT